MADISFPDFARLYLREEHEITIGHNRHPTLRWSTGSMYRYQGSYYKEWDPDRFKAHLTTWLDKRGLTTLRHFREIEAHVKAALITASPESIPCWTCHPPRTGRWMAFKNGILDLDDLIANGTSTLVPHTPDWFSTIVLPYEYSEKASCPVFTRCLDDWFPEDPATQSLVQEMVGYVFWPSIPIHGGFFLEGRGRNGKSTLLTMLSKLVGKDNFSSIPMEDFKQQFSLVETIDKLVNFSSETDPGARLPLATLKRFTAGDPFTVDRKFQKRVTFVPSTKLIVAWNERPAIHDSSDGFWSRIKLIPFLQTFPEGGPHTDIDLDVKLEAELSGIFNWAIAGLRRMIKARRFTVSAVGKAAGAAFRDQSDPMRAYFLEFWGQEPGREVTKLDCYNHYLQYRLDDFDEPLAEGKFFRELYRCLPGVEAGRQRGSRGQRVPVLLGIRLKDSANDG